MSDQKKTVKYILVSISHQQVCGVNSLVKQGSCYRCNYRFGISRTLYKMLHLMLTFNWLSADSKYKYLLNMYLDILSLPKWWRKLLLEVKVKEC